MKKGFVKRNWASLVFVILFITASIFLRDTLIIVVTVIFTLAFINHYWKYDADVQMYDEWWNGLDKEDKKEMYNQAQKVNGPGEESDEF